MRSRRRWGAGSAQALSIGNFFAVIQSINLLDFWANSEAHRLLVSQRDPGIKVYKQTCEGSFHCLLPSWFGETKKEFPASNARRIMSAKTYLVLPRISRVRNGVMGLCLSCVYKKKERGRELKLCVHNHERRCIRFKSVFLTNFLKMGQLFFVYFRFFLTNNKTFTINVKNVKMNIQYTAPVFEPTTLRTWVLDP